MKTIQQDLKSNNLYLDEAIDLTLESDVYVWCCALVVMLVRNDGDEADDAVCDFADFISTGIHR